MSDEDILRHYFGPYQINKPYISPLRRYSNDKYEDTPSFVIKKKQGKLLWCDFGAGYKWRKPIAYVKELFGISWREAVNKIKNDDALGIKYDFVATEIPDKLATVVLGEMRPFELAYWKSNYISKKTLDLFRVCSCRELYYDDSLWAVSIPSDPLFYYGHGVAGWTVYRPLAEDKKDKFRKKRVTSGLLGLEFIPKYGDTLIITKSYKDVMFLRELGFYAVCPQSEVVHLLASEVEMLKSRFKNIFLVFDNDDTGRKRSRELSKLHDLMWWETPIELGKEGKDMTGMCKLVGRYKTLQYIKLKCHGKRV